MSTVANVWRLLKAARVFARHDALLLPEYLAVLPAPARAGLAVLRLGAPAHPVESEQGRLADALTELGPSYIKLGQFLSTRPDIIGGKRAFELKTLQDRLPPFPQPEAEDTVARELGQPVAALFAEFGPAVAAASIAQVHKARLRDGRAVAVKILRPGVEKRFAADMESFTFAASLMERLSAEGRRLRPIDAVAMLKQSMDLELDLRMEAAALSEMAENSKDDAGLRFPAIHWDLTARRVLTTEWIDATPMADVAALRASGHDLVKLADTLVQSFLRHAIRDGFFHADMHQGNLMVDRAGQIVPLDYGIMGRLIPRERLFLAEILHGFIVRDYERVAQVHFDAGYVPRSEDPAIFAQALRAIGEPIMGLAAEDVSMSRLLTQLFDTTAQFNMTTQPQLLLLQKTMVVVEGVARTLNPHFNMWKAGETVVSGWIAETLGPLGTLKQGAQSALALGKAALALPDILDEARRASEMLSAMAKSGGLRLDEETAMALAREQRRHSRWRDAAIIAGGLALVALALAVLW
jgi:ubiquinone biosynthesis protein